MVHMALTPQSILRDWILAVLAESPGRALPRRELLNELENRYGSKMTAADKESPPSRPFETKWRNNASYERADMVREGMLKPRADGVWELSSTGEGDDAFKGGKNDFRDGGAWLVTSNPRRFDARKAFEAKHEVDWSETENAHLAVGDIVYLYGSEPIGALTHQCLVVRVGIPFDEVIDDSAYWFDRETLNARAARSWMRLRLVRAFTKDEREQLSIAALQGRGLKRAPQGRMRVPSKVSELIAQVLAITDSRGSDDAAAESAPVNGVEVEELRLRADDGDFSVPDLVVGAKTRGSAQRVFSDNVKRNYEYRCALTGIKTRDFLVASHIVPWSADQSIRLDPSNGICFSTLVDRAFDTGFLSVLPDGRVQINREKIVDDPVLEEILAKYEGNVLREPRIAPPKPEYLTRRLHG